MSVTLSKPSFTAVWLAWDGSTYSSAPMPSLTDACLQASTLLTEYDIPMPVSHVRLFNVEAESTVALASVLVDPDGTVTVRTAVLV